MKAKKKFGQHFLIDKNIVSKIVEAAEISPGERVVEIGPGRGVLTRALLKAGASVTAIEVDRDLSEPLQEVFGEDPNFTLIISDCLDIDYIELAGELHDIEIGSEGAVASDRKIKLVSNLPYNISGPLIAKFIEERQAFTSLVLMIQKEVAMRLTAKPSTKDYGSLTVMARAFTETRRLFDVAPTCFRPVPKVNSSVIKMIVPYKVGEVYYDGERVEVEDEAHFKRVVRGAFSQRRKTLNNTMRSIGYTTEEIAAAFSSIGMDPGRRGETLTVLEFVALSRALACKG